MSTSTQTESNVDLDDDHVGHGQTANQSLQQVGYSIQPNHTDVKGGRDCLDSPPLSSPLAYLDFSVQTDIATSSEGQDLSGSFDLNSLSTQTDFFKFCTRSASSQTYLVSDTREQVTDAYLQTSPEPNAESVTHAVLPPDVNFLHCSTGPVQSLECVGTQTTGGDHKEVGFGMATQTYPDDFFSPLTEGDSRIDFGTQTMDWLADVESLLPNSCL